MRIRVLAAVLFAAASLGAQSTLSTCSSATLKGTFGALEQGTFLAAQPGLPTPPFAIVISGMATYDGAGNLSGSFTASFGGVIVPGTFSGTYEVASDCTYSDQFTAAPLGLVLHRAGTLTAGPQLNFIYTDPVGVVWGTSRRIPEGGCSLALLQGTYGLQGQGTVYNAMPGFTPPFPGAHSGILTADGAGNMSGSDTMILAGIVIPDTFTITYTVKRNCAYTSTITTSLGVFHETGSITGAGKAQQITKVMTDPGMVWVDTVRKQ